MSKNPTPNKVPHMVSTILGPKRSVALPATIPNEPYKRKNNEAAPDVTALDQPNSVSSSEKITPSFLVYDKLNKSLKLNNNFKNCIIKCNKNNLVTSNKFRTKGCLIICENPL